MKTDLTLSFAGVFPAVFAMLLSGACACAQAAEPAAGASASLEVRVFDAATEAPLSGVTVALDSGGPVTSGSDGRTRFAELPAGRYEITLFKPGYRLGTITDVQIQAGQEMALVFPLQVRPPEEDLGGDIYEMEEFVITATALMNSDFTLRQMRFEASFAMDTLSFADLARFASSDVADAIKRIPGVNVQEGKFAVIRGLDERYTSTLLNGMAIPSPDPDRQSPQLDLFPAEVVGSLVVAKSFAPELPGNSAGGSINIVTTHAPDARELKLGAGTGFNDNARDLFHEASRGSSIGTPTDDQWKEYDLGLSFGMPFLVGQRLGRLNSQISSELDFETRIGTSTARSPVRSSILGVLRDDTNQVVRDEQNRPVFEASLGDFAKGILGRSDGVWDTSVSTRDERLSGFLSLGMDLDEAGDHKVDLVYFQTGNDEESVDFRSNGRFPGLEGFSGTAEAFRSQVAAVSTPGVFLTNAIRDDDPVRGAKPSSVFYSSSAFFRERDFKVGQLFGQHAWEQSRKLSLKWAFNYAETSQAEEASRFTYWYQPDGTIPTDPDQDGVYRTTGGQSGGNPLFFSANSIDEEQLFGRADLTWESPFGGQGRTLQVSGGVFVEAAERQADSTFADRVVGSADEAAKATGETAALLETNFLAAGGGYSNQSADTAFTRDIRAGYLGAKLVLSRKLEFLAGVRLEQIDIRSDNNPYTGQDDFSGIPGIFPSKYYMFEVVDDPVFDGYGVAQETYATSNAALLGIELPVGPDGIVNLSEDDIRRLLSGVIDETHALPSLGAVWRPLAGMRVLANFSETVARPSFRELGYYLSASPDSDDLTIGNPQLSTSAVRSYDLRLEYAFGENGDLVAGSVFDKDISDPIEKIILTDKLTGVEAQTFFNNPNPAALQGFELEARKNLGFAGPDWLGFFSLGANFTFIDASVRRSQAEIDRMQSLFALDRTGAGLEARTRPDPDQKFTSLPPERKLFNQPEWITNADLTFEHAGWGTTATLSVFAISEVLASAGSITLDPVTGVPLKTIPDRYNGAYLQWDLVIQQRWRQWSFKFSVKNLTDTDRTRHYDSELLDPEIEEKRYSIGRDYSISASYAF